MRLPELSVDRGELGELRSDVGSRMELGIRKMSPNEAQGIEALQEGLQWNAGGKAERTAEVPILNQRQPGRVGAGDVIAVDDGRQRAGGRGGHPVYVTQCSHPCDFGRQLAARGTSSAKYGICSLLWEVARPGDGQQPPPSVRSVLEHQRDALARADTDAEHAVPGFALAQLRPEREPVAVARRPERVADGDRAPIGVQ